MNVLWNEIILAGKNFFIFFEYLLTVSFARFKWVFGWSYDSARSFGNLWPNNRRIWRSENAHRTPKPILWNGVDASFLEIVAKFNYIYEAMYSLSQPVEVGSERLTLLNSLSVKCDFYRFFFFIIIEMRYFSSTLIPFVDYCSLYFLSVFFPHLPIF